VEPKFDRTVNAPALGLIVRDVRSECGVEMAPDDHCVAVRADRPRSTGWISVDMVDRFIKPQPATVR